MTDIEIMPPMKGWQLIETRPTKDHEYFIVAVSLKGPGYEKITLELHVETWGGQMYPLHLEGAIDWNDRVVGATFWRPLSIPKCEPETAVPKMQEALEHIASYRFGHTGETQRLALYAHEILSSPISDNSNGDTEQ